MAYRELQHASCKRSIQRPGQSIMKTSFAIVLSIPISPTYRERRGGNLERRAGGHSDARRLLNHFPLVGPVVGRTMVVGHCIYSSTL
ncbi:hypothetical protein L596_005020 [Steinernema carpocapsae]|uniref:Uncharacterized protein n=1 Tax=Steinernema carpocapsae TaxID=34508 RepID=A0A4U8UZ52_STECR|nr:hypothetical protein L596_005020 [Steinernema carpocapsae]